MNILLTGGAGYIGSHTAVALIEAGFEPVVLDNFANSHPLVLDRLARITGQSVSLERGDVLDTAWLQDVLRCHRPDGVVHFAGDKAVGESVEQPLKYFHNNIGGAVSLLRAMENVHAETPETTPTLVFSSSATVYGDPQQVPITEDSRLQVTNPYGRTKLMCEDILRDLQAERVHDFGQEQRVPALPGRALGHRAADLHRVAAVGEGRARRPRQRHRQDVERAGLQRRAAIGQAGVLGDVDAAGVRIQLGQRDGMGRRGRFGEPLADGAVPAQHAALDQAAEHQRRQPLAGRGNGHALVAAVAAEAFLHQHLALAGEPQRGAVQRVVAYQRLHCQPHGLQVVRGPRRAGARQAQGAKAKGEREGEPAGSGHGRQNAARGPRLTPGG